MAGRSHTVFPDGVVNQSLRSSPGAMAGRSTTIIVIEYSDQLVAILARRDGRAQPAGSAPKRVAVEAVAILARRDGRAQPVRSNPITDATPPLRSSPGA